MASLFLHDLSGNSVHVGSTLGGELLTNANFVIFVFRDEFDLGNVGVGVLAEFLHNIADVLSSSSAVVLSAGTEALVATVVFTEGMDTRLLFHVKLVANGGGAGVEPVFIIGGKFSSGGGLDVLGPLHNIIINIPFNVERALTHTLF